jgi:hypothetical protein
MNRISNLHRPGHCFYSPVALSTHHSILEAPHAPSISAWAIKLTLPLQIRMWIIRPFLHLPIPSSHNKNAPFPLRKQLIRNPMPTGNTLVPTRHAPPAIAFWAYTSHGYLTLGPRFLDLAFGGREGLNESLAQGETGIFDSGVEREGTQREGDV